MKKTELQNLKSKYGEWALITGASSGLGKEFALHLAAAGINVIITARRQVLLNSLAEELVEKYKVQVKIIAGDITDAAVIKRIIDTAENLNTGLAIMNAGFATSGYFLKSDVNDELNMIDVNCRSLFILTHFFSRYFAAKKRGGIILISSIVAFQGTPYAAHYAATKAYVQSLGEGIAQELKVAGVDVLIAAPGPVQTGFAERAKMNVGNAMMPEKITAEMLTSLGKKTTSLPGLLTKLLVAALSLLPRWGKVKVMSIVMKGMTKDQRL